VSKISTLPKFVGDAVADVSGSLECRINTDDDLAENVFAADRFSDEPFTKLEASGLRVNTLRMLGCLIRQPEHNNAISSGALEPVRFPFDLFDV
jgi:hypothetical protein